MGGQETVANARAAAARLARVGMWPAARLGMKHDWGWTGSWRRRRHYKLKLNEVRDFILYIHIYFVAFLFFIIFAALLALAL